MHIRALASPQTGRGMVSVELVTVTESYRESFIESSRSPSVEGRACVCVVCVCGKEVQGRDNATMAKAHGYCCSLSSARPSCGLRYHSMELE